MTDELKECPKHPGSEYHSACAVCVVEARLEAPRRYPIAPHGVFWSLQGEGHLRGFQMGFVRLAGCSVGCPQCDTDYSVAEKLTADELTVRCFATYPRGSRDQWVWITGGEPADHDLRPLLAAMKRMGYSTAVATSGVKRVIPPVDWLSVSPHSIDPDKFQQRYGNEVKLVDGLYGLDLEAWVAEWDSKPGQIDFMYRYVQPMSVRVAVPGPLDPPDTRSTGFGFVPTDATGRHRVGTPTYTHRYEEDPASLARCLAFLRRHPTWALSRQDHHVWGVA